MKILHTVELYHPSVGGMQEVVKQISERLVALGHDVTVATKKLPERKSSTMNGVTIVEFKVTGDAVRGMAGETEMYVNYLIKSDFDVITNFAAQQWATDLALTALDKIRAKKVFVPTGFSGLYDIHYTGYFDGMKQHMKKYDMNVFLSDDYRDVNFAKANGIDKRVLIPNGAGADEFLPDCDFSVKERLGIPRDYLLVLHVGSHTGVKGHREAIKIFKKAAIRKAALLIIGNVFPGSGCYHECARAERFFGWSIFGKKTNKRLLVRDLSRAATVAAYKEADLFLFPSNIECSPIVLFECMAAKTPFLTTDVGNAKEIIEWSKAGLLIPTVKDRGGFGYCHADIRASARLLNELANDEKRRETMADAGFNVWQARFTWDIIAKEYEKLYKRLINR